MTKPTTLKKQGEFRSKGIHLELNGTILSVVDSLFIDYLFLHSIVYNTFEQCNNHPLTCVIITYDNMILHREIKTFFLSNCMPLYIIVYTLVEPYEGDRV